MNKTIKNVLLWGAFAGALSAGVMTALVYDKIRKIGKLHHTWPDEVIEGTLALEALIAFYQTLNLDKDMQEPIVITSDSEYFEDYVGTKKKSGKKAVALCVYHIQDNEVEPHKVIYCKDFDGNIKSMIDDEGMIRLKLS